MSEGYKQVSDQIGGHVRDQVRNQVWNQVEGQVRDQVWGQVAGPVWDHVWYQVRNRVRRVARKNRSKKNGIRNQGV